MQTLKDVYSDYKTDILFFISLCFVVTLVYSIKNPEFIMDSKTQGQQLQSMLEVSKKIFGLDPFVQ